MTYPPTFVPFRTWSTEALVAIGAELRPELLSTESARTNPWSRR